MWPVRCVHAPCRGDLQVAVRPAAATAWAQPLYFAQAVWNAKPSLVMRSARRPERAHTSVDDAQCPKCEGRQRSALGAMHLHRGCRSPEGVRLIDLQLLRQLLAASLADWWDTTFGGGSAVGATGPTKRATGTPGLCLPSLDGAGHQTQSRHPCMSRGWRVAGRCVTKLCCEEAPLWAAERLRSQCAVDVTRAVADQTSTPAPPLLQLLSRPRSAHPAPVVTHSCRALCCCQTRARAWSIRVGHPRRRRLHSAQASALTFCHRNAAQSKRSEAAKLSGPACRLQRHWHLQVNVSGHVGLADAAIIPAAD